MYLIFLPSNYHPKFVSGWDVITNYSNFDIFPDLILRRWTVSGLLIVISLICKQNQEECPAQWPELTVWVSNWHSDNW